MKSERRELVPPRVRRIVEDFASANLVLRVIEREFECEGVAKAEGFPPAQGVRRTATRAYLSSLDFADRSDVARFLRVLSAMMREVGRATPAGTLGDPFEPLVSELRRTGFEWTGEEVRVDSAPAVPLALRAVAERWDAAEVRRQLDRADAAVEPGSPHATRGSRWERRRPWRPSSWRRTRRAWASANPRLDRTRAAPPASLLNPPVRASAAHRPI
jgi:hypothetical protein